MKRIFAFVLTMVMLASFAACGMVDVEGDGEVGGFFSPIADGDGGEEDNTLMPVDFERYVVVDNEYCTIEITGIGEDILWGYSISTQLENKSEDKTYMFSLQSASINGVEVDSLFAAEVAPGKKAVENITFLEDDLENNGIEQYTDIQLDFRVYDSNDWTADEVALVSTHIYPYGGENATTFVREAKPQDVVLVDNDSVTVLATGYREDALWGYTIDIYIVNKTETTVMVSVDEASVNGFMADPFFATDVVAGKCAFASISWSDSEFEKSGITEVEEIEFQLRVYDYNNWMADDFANEKVTLKP